LFTTEVEKSGFRKRGIKERRKLGLLLVGNPMRKARYLNELTGFKPQVGNFPGSLWRKKRLVKPKISGQSNCQESN